VTEIVNLPDGKGKPRRKVAWLAVRDITPLELPQERRRCLKAQRASEKLFSFYRRLGTRLMKSSNMAVRGAPRVRVILKSGERCPCETKSRHAVKRDG